MRITWTTAQQQRLRELNATSPLQEMTFPGVKERDRDFHDIECLLVRQNRQRLVEMRNVHRRPALCELEKKLVNMLIDRGFVQVLTPIILAKSLLAKMSITPEHPLFKQVFWIDERRCLRPMLAPNLYHLLKKLVRLWKKPIRIFEVGPCFRKDSKGKYHLNEFTMLNLVELGLPKGEGNRRLAELIAMVMSAADVKRYQLIPNQCEVYGKTVDIISNSNIEVGSGVIGPHILDKEWGIVDPWVGIGFGLERLVMVKKGYRNIQRVGRSLVYLDGVHLNI
ncbi:MAG: pyrrolysine--tRNA(Pyl) ligase large subunit [Thaumarchaeota archaeon]|nr:MAG: pyrrolysine--tRNA(Pyl) ligase large subunit [Nitrososphaerota archaeon]